MIHLQGVKRHHLHGVMHHHLQGNERHHLQAVKHHHLQGSKNHHLQDAKQGHLEGVMCNNLLGIKCHQLQKERRPNITFQKRRQEERIFINKHPLMIIANIKRIQDVVQGIFAMKTENTC